ncbi:MAG TPA: FdhF/YdeP family oxidoreductase [Acidobacteriota bacterium]|nr:FdhF/YdeP family oxidoreductase [Acidobacteriota bacterium]
MSLRKGYGTGTVSWSPFGLGKEKPNHYLEMARVFWENRDNLGYAWRILRHGVCDGCSLGPYGFRDDTMKGIHLCLTRLRLLRINTMPALDMERLADVETLSRMTGEALRQLGRLPYPMIRNKGETRFRRITWEDALGIAAQRMTNIDPHRFALYTTSRGLTNEVYYAASKFTRLLGSNNIDNAARLCHAASTTALKYTLGIAASSCSNKDWIGASLIVLAGANIANNQPVATKYLYYAKQKGARIVVVNPYREPGLDSYWIPSVTKSALFGTRLMDDFFPIGVGGDVAFYNGVLKVLVERDWIDHQFIRNHTVGFDALKESLAAQPWDMLEKHSGAPRREMERFAEIYGRAPSAIFIWSMGLTQHRFGVDNVKALTHLALARGMIGRPHTGVVPIRGHSGVQGAAEVGSVPGDFAAGIPVNDANARLMEEHWKVTGVPAWKGLSAPEMLDAAHGGDLDVFYIMGGNFVETMPDPAYAREALERVPLRIHQDLFLNSSMLADSAGTVLLFPGQTRYEQKGGGTITSTERRVRFSPEIPGPRIGESRSEWEILVDLGRRILPAEKAASMSFTDAQQIRDEIDNVIPMYRGIKDLKREKDSFQYGGPMLLQNGVCSALPEGKARFSVLTPQNEIPGPGAFYLTTRRGKQFNTMLHGTVDPLTGSATRSQIFLSPEDTQQLGLKEGDRIVLKSVAGEYRGICRIAPVKSGTVQGFWPEVNVLLPRRTDPESRAPDYNVIVRITPEM